MKKNDSDTRIEVMEIKRSSVKLAIIGDSPLIMNRLAEKARQELLFPKRKKRTDADRLGILKHNPPEEFRSAVNKMSDKSQPTYLALPTTAFKKAIGTAALDSPGARKTEIGRLTSIAGGEYLPVYGIPKLFMRNVRSSDMNRTPDIRTRAILPEWACYVEVFYVTPNLNDRSIVNLMHGAGLTVGVGDGRQERGTFSFGQFRIVDPNDADFKRIVRTGGRDVQIAAMEAAEPYDDETEELLSWFEDELKRRGDEAKAQPKADAKKAESGKKARRGAAE
jgi:hypothetical protein